MTDTPKVNEPRERRVERGMLLLLHERGDPEVGLPERARLWTVTAVRKRASSSSATLIAHLGDAIAEATVTFPDGVVREPFRLLELSDREQLYLWARTAPRSIR